MDAMTARAADAGFGVIRAEEVRVSARVALQTGRVDLFRGHLGHLENFCRISAGRNMCSAWSMAALTGDTFAAMHERKLRVGVRRELCRNIRVAQSTSL